MIERRFEVGDGVVWRSRPEGRVGYVIAGWVLFDEPDGQAIVQPTGSQVARRGGLRGGPQGRSLLPGSWDGTHQVGTWDGPSSVRLHPAEKPYAVLRRWLADDQRYAGWYVNLERPWTRTPVGFDGRDLVLDVTVADDLSRWGLKDEDELDWEVQVGKATRHEHDFAHAAAEEAMDDLASRSWPFHESAWPAVPRELIDRTALLPDGWDRL